MIEITAEEDKLGVAILLMMKERMEPLRASLLLTHLLNLMGKARLTHGDIESDVPAKDISELIHIAANTWAEEKETLTMNKESENRAYHARLARFYLGENTELYFRGRVHCVGDRVVDLGRGDDWEGALKAAREKRISLLAFTRIHEIDTTVLEDGTTWIIFGAQWAAVGGEGEGHRW